MEPEIIAALIAGIVSATGLLVTTYWSKKTVSEQLHSQEVQWQESFRAELRRDLARDSTLLILENRIQCYSVIWLTLEKTSGYYLKRMKDPKIEIQELADELTRYAYDKQGLLMSERSRKLLNHLRSGCGDYLKEKTSIEELQARAHMLKHSMRSDLGIQNSEYDIELNQIAQNLGRVDDWHKSDK